MLGSFAVGKTSLVSQYVRGLFSDKYHTTVGVKIDKKNVKVGDSEVSLILWDLHGDDEFQRMQDSYLRGTAAYFLVVDGTRSATLEKALTLQARAELQLGDVPFITLLNKNDLISEWEIPDSRLEVLQSKGFQVMKTSAKTGEGVEDAFQALAELTLRAVK